jgi:hypothetical protein
VQGRIPRFRHYHRDDGEDCQGYQNRAFENIKASLNAALDHAKGGEAASKDIGGFSLESNFLTVLKEAATEFRADAVELICHQFVTR